MEEISTLISFIGFPIVAWFQMAKCNKELIGAIQELAISTEGINIRLAMLENQYKK